MIVPVAYLEISLEQVDHRPVADGLAVGDGGSVHDHPLMHPMGVGELVDQPGFADARLTNDCHHLATPPLGSGLNAFELLHFGATTDEACQPPGRQCLEARLPRSRTNELVHRFAKETIVRRPEHLHLDMTLRQSQRLCTDKQSPGCCDLSKPDGKLRRSSHRPPLRLRPAPD